MSNFLEKPQSAPMTTPTVRLMAAQIKARDTEILAPVQSASNVDWPLAPDPRIQWMLIPISFKALDGERCLAALLKRFV